MTNGPIPEEWWKGGYFFGNRYIESDNSIEGYLPGNKESLEERTDRESEGIVNLLSLTPGAKILDVPCGYGRHSRALAAKGFKVTGLDIDREHLAKANALSGKDVEYLVRDMRDIGNDLHSQYDAVINMFYSFGFFSEEDDNIRTMEQFYEALQPEGKLLLHTDVSPEMLKNNTTQTNTIRRLPGDRNLIILENYNDTTRRMEGSWETTDLIGNVIHPRAFYSVRIYSAEEFKDLANNAGFYDVRIYGSFNGERFSEKSSEMIMTARK